MSAIGLTVHLLPCPVAGALPASNRSSASAIGFDTDADATTTGRRQEQR
ncbi:hypothetical protein [Agrococcus versicolor]